jgi:hypothetical protein
MLIYRIFLEYSLTRIWYLQIDFMGLKPAKSQIRSGIYNYTVFIHDYVAFIVVTRIYKLQYFKMSGDNLLPRI